MSADKQSAPRCEQLGEAIVIDGCVLDILSLEIGSNQDPQLFVMMTPGEIKAGANMVFPTIPLALERRFKATAALCAGVKS